MIINDLLIFVLSVSFILSILYILSNFNYQISDKHIEIRWKILGFIPFISSKIKINEIENVKKFEFKKDVLVPTQILGNLFIKQGIIVSLKGKIFKYNVYLTPKDCEQFITEINVRHQNRDK